MIQALKEKYYVTDTFAKQKFVRIGGIEMSKGDFARVIKSKYIPSGTFVEILGELQEGIFLCATPSNESYIVVAKNLMPITEE